MSTRDISSNTRQPPSSVITEKKKKPVEDIIKHPLKVADLISKLNELPPDSKLANLVIRTESGANFVDKVEFTTCNNENDDSKIYCELKISSELGLKAY